MFLERLEHGAPARTVGREDRPVDVEQDETSGALAIGRELSSWR
jgi:hypothetical protein